MVSCLTTDIYPTIATVKAGYGTEAVNFWLEAQLMVLNNSSNVREKLTDQQVADISCIIVHDPILSVLTIAEIMLFCYWLSSGEFGTLYGNIDAMSILSKLRTDFMKKRNHIITEWEQEQKVKRMEAHLADPNNITYQEWVRRGKPLQ